MFRNLLSRLFADDTDDAPLQAQDAEVAIAALLVRVARADDRYETSERQRIDQILARRRGLNMAEAAERRAVAEMIEAEAPDTVRFTRLIKDRIPLEDRAVQVARAGTHTRGRTRVDERGPRTSAEANCRVAYGVDADAVIALIMEAVREA